MTKAWKRKTPPRKFRPGNPIRDPLQLAEQAFVFERGRLQSTRWIVNYQFAHVMLLLRNGLIREAIVTREWLEWSSPQPPDCNSAP